MNTERNQREVAMLSIMRTLDRSGRSKRPSSVLKRAKRRHPEIEMEIFREALYSGMNKEYIKSDWNYRIELTHLGREFLNKADRR